MGSYRKVLVGTDGSATATLAVDRAAAIAGDSGAALHIVTAYEPEPKDVVRDAENVLKDEAYLVVGSAPAERVLREAKDRAEARGARTVATTAVQGPAVAVLDKAVADSAAELVVVGNVGLNTLAGRILGSVPQSVARRAGVDVLIVHTTSTATRQPR